MVEFNVDQHPMRLFRTNSDMMFNIRDILRPWHWTRKNDIRIQLSLLEPNGQPIEVNTVLHI